MEDSSARPLTMPTDRERPLDPPDALREIRARCPVGRMTYPDGHEGWLVTGDEAVRTVLAEPRLSARGELKRPPIAVAGAARHVTTEPPPGLFGEMDPPEHTMYRRLVAAQFTERRMERLSARITANARECVANLRRAGPPADLVATFALPMPSMTICELLGVPYEERERFQLDPLVSVNLESSPEQVFAATMAVHAFVAELVQAKRKEPTDDVLGGLVATAGLSDEELVNIAMIMLLAGFDTVANMIALGVLAVLEEPSRAAALRDPARVDGAVEELLRYLSIVHVGPVRTALEDVDLDGHRIAAGDTVTVSLAAANRDPARFADPDRLDLDRPATSNVAFGYGRHVCIGRHLARVELRAAYSTLFTEFPDLRLAVPAADIPLRSARTDMIYGVRELPVAW
jgi:cytochrome P450